MEIIEQELNLLFHQILELDKLYKNSQDSRFTYEQCRYFEKTYKDAQRQFFENKNRFIEKWKKEI